MDGSISTPSLTRASNSISQGVLSRQWKHEILCAIDQEPDAAFGASSEQTIGACLVWLMEHERIGTTHTTNGGLTIVV